MSKLTIWLTPLWLLAVGIVIGAALVGVVWGILYIVNRRAARAMSSSISESILRPVTYFVVALAALAALASPLMPVSQTIASLKRLPYVESIHRTVEVKPQTDDMVVEAPFRASELQSYSIASDQDVAVNVAPG